MGWPRGPEQVVPWAMDRAAQKHPLTRFLRGLRGSLRALICDFDRGEPGNRRRSETLRSQNWPWSFGIVRRWLVVIRVRREEGELPLKSGLRRYLQPKS